jgi:hypothetical protein
MLKHLSILAALAAFGIVAAHAEQREAILQKVEVPNAGFDIVLVMAKPGGPTLGLRSQPDPHVLYLMGGELVQAYTGELQGVFGDIGALTVPACAFHTEGKGSGWRTPVAVYVVPKNQSQTLN